MSNDYFQAVKETLASMESGELDYTKDGKCVGCGACCSNILPVTDREIKNIKKYMNKHAIKEQPHVYPTNLYLPRLFAHRYGMCRTVRRKNSHHRVWLAPAKQQSPEYADRRTDK